VANAFAATPEYIASTAGKTTAQIVADFYQRMFNRQPESAGLSYWVNEINRGALSTQSVGLALLTSAQSQTGTADNTAVSSKLTAANQFTAEVAKTSAGILAYSGVNGLATGVQFLAPVQTDATIPTAAQTTATVDALIAANGGGTTETLALSVFSDVFTTSTGVRIIGNTAEQVPFRFTPSNQVVNAAAGTITNGFGVADTLTDPSTIDNDTLNVGAGNYNTGLFGPLSPVKFSNIENINFNFANETAPGGIVFANGAGATNFASGVKTITASGSLAAPTLFANFGDSGATTFNGSGLSSGAPNGIGVTSYADQAATNPNVTITGSQDVDNLLGGGGNDTINGGVGGDAIFGNGGADLLNGGDGVDNIEGNQGNDTLNGGTAADILTGGPGRDTYVYDSLTASFTDANADTIIGFIQGTGAERDVLRLSASAFTGLTAASTFVFTTRAGAENVATNVLVDTQAQIALATGTDALSNTRLAYAIDTGNWLYDANGDWGSDRQIFTNTPGLTLAGLNTANLAVVA